MPNESTESLDQWRTAIPARLEDARRSGTLGANIIQITQEASTWFDEYDDEIEVVLHLLEDARASMDQAYRAHAVEIFFGRLPKPPVEHADAPLARKGVIEEYCNVLKRLTDNLMLELNLTDPIVEYRWDEKLNKFIIEAVVTEVQFALLLLRAPLNEFMNRIEAVRTQVVEATTAFHTALVNVSDRLS